MRRKYFSLLFIFLFTFSFISCANSSEPTELDKISTNPIKIEINVDPDSLHLDSEPLYSIDYSDLNSAGIMQTEIFNYHSNLSQNIIVDREFVLAEKEVFIVEIKNCNPDYEWIIETGNNEFPENYWINNEISLVRALKDTNADNSINYNYVFANLKNVKGYICFIEKDSTGRVSSNDLRGFLIGYSINPLEQIKLNLNEITWIYNTEEGSFSTVSVLLKGTTNLYRLRGMTHGDGVLMAIEIPIDENGNFESEITLAFSHVEGIRLTTNCELILYGSVGLPRVVTLRNPENN